MTCRWCRRPMGYVHGHAACLDSSCPMFGLNQAECCDGETVATCPAPTSDVGARVTGPQAASGGGSARSSAVPVAADPQTVTDS